MKIAFVTAGGPFGLRALQSLASDHEIVAVVRPADLAPAWKRLARVPAQRLRLRHRDVVADWLRRTTIPTIDAAQGGGEALAGELSRRGPDLICIATFPWLLGSELLVIPRYGVINLHPSALPRHRGPNPLFWTYYHDDRFSGVTAHVAEARADAGPILAQERIEIPRGWPSSQLYLAMATAGALVLHSAVESIERGTARPVSQADHLSTYAPRLKGGAAMIDSASWDVERTWHFLAGLNPWYKEPLTTSTGRRVRYGDVIAFDRGTPTGRTGYAHTTPGGFALACRDGEVRLGRRSLVPTRVSIDPEAERS